MASYGTKYTFGWDDAAGVSCEVRVQKAGYIGSPTTLTAARRPFEVTWGQQGQTDMTQPLLISTARLRFMGSSAGEQVEEVFDSPDRQWRVQHLEGGSLEWQGYLATDLWRDNPDISADTIELEAIDGLALTENYEADDEGGVLATVLNNILAGNNYFFNDPPTPPIYTSMDWHSYDASIGSGQCPLDVYKFGTKAYKQLDDNGDSEAILDQRAQLEDICERFGLQLFQASGAWHLRQRDQVDDGTALKRWKMGTSEAVFGSSPTTDDVTASLPFQTARTEKPRSRVARLRSVKSSYSYDDLGELVANGSFEDGLSPWTTTGTVNRKKYSNTAGNEVESQEDTYVLVMDDGSVALPSGDKGSLVEQDIPAILYNAGPRSTLEVSWDIYDEINSAGITETRIQLGNYYVQARRIEVAKDTAKADDGTLPLKQPLPGAVGTLIAPEDATLRTGDASADDNPGEITLTEPARAGDEILHGQISTQVKKDNYVLFFVWSDTTTTSFEGTKEHWGLLNAYLDYPTPLESESSFNPQQLRIPLHTPQGDILADKQLRFAVWSDNDSDSSATYRTFLDHVSMKHLIDGEPIGATTYIAVDDHFGRERTLTHRIGVGPTKTHPRRVFDDGKADILDGWKPAPYSAGESSTGKGLEQLLAEQWMRQRRETLDRRTFQFEARGQDVGPQHVYQLDGNAYTPTFLRYVSSSYGNTGTIELTEVKDAGLSGLTQAFSMESDTDGSVRGTGSTIISDQTVDGVSSWSELTGKPFSSIGDFLGVKNGDLDVQLGDGLQGDGSNQITLDDDQIARTDVDETFDKDLNVLGSLFVEGDRTVQNVEILETEDNLLFTGKGAAGSGAAAEWSGMEVDRGYKSPFRFAFKETDDLFRVGKLDVELSVTDRSGSISTGDRVVGQSSGASGYLARDYFGLQLKGVSGSFQDGETLEKDGGGWSATVSSVSVTDDTQAVATRPDSPTDNALFHWNSDKNRLDTSPDFTYDGDLNISGGGIVGDRGEIDFSPELTLTDTSDDSQGILLDAYKTTLTGELVFRDDQGRGDFWKDFGFSAGLLGGDGVAAYEDANDRTVVEADVIRARDYIEALEFIVQEVKATGGSIVVSAGAMKVSGVSGSGPYTLKSEDDHTLAAGDAIEAKRSGTNAYFSQLRVTSVVDSKTVEATLHSGDAPAAGMEFVVLGNDQDTDRQNVMLITATINPAPRIEMFENSTGWDLGNADSTGQLGADIDGNMVLEATKGRLGDSMTIGRVRREDQKVRAWDQPYAGDAAGNYEKTLQTVIRPENGRIHVGLINGTDTSSGVDYTVKVHLSDPLGGASFDTSNSDTNSSVWGGTGDTLIFSNGDKTATLSGSHSTGSDTFELAVSGMTGDTQVEIEITQWDTSSISTFAVTAGATVIDTHDTEDPTEWSSSDPYRMYYLRSATSISGGTIVANTITANQISVGSVTDIDSDAATISDVFSGDYNDLSGKPSLGDVASLNNIDSTYIADGAIITSKIAAGSVTASEIKADTITANEIDAGTITASEISTNTLSATEIDADQLFTESFTVKSGGSIQNADGDWDITGTGFGVYGASGRYQKNSYSFIDGSTEEAAIFLNTSLGDVEWVVDNNDLNFDINNGEFYAAVNDDIDLNAGGEAILDGTDGVRLRSDDVDVEVRKINGGTAIVFKDTTNGQPTKSQIEHVLLGNEAVLYAIEYSDGNINLGWAETDQYGNVQNRSNTF